MSDIVISVENLSKAYRLGQIGTGTLSNDMKAWWAKARGKPNPFLKIGEKDHGNRDGEIIWALKDVSFSVNQGDVLGIIGKNGAGKSTLLKILSRVTAPTSGRVKVKGRIASLLEVGTGFHPDLTGRENTYLNGAILGMTRQEVRRKLDEIVSFAEVEQFIDTPVKRYSSGMFVRLAFAVAAHLDPEILVVDEVLAVGDAEFQKKCLGKMGDVSKEGRTVLFVSHNMAAIENLCPRSILISQGKVDCIGESKEIIANYLSTMGFRGTNEIPGQFDLSNHENKYSKDIVVRRIKIMNDKEEYSNVLLMGRPVSIYVSLYGFAKYRDATVGLIIKNLRNEWLTSITTGMSCSSVEVPRTEEEEAVLHIPRLPLAPGKYYIDISIYQIGIGRIDYTDNLAYFDVVEADVYNNGGSQTFTPNLGTFFIDATWEVKNN
jgi:lipopolysaccharide transport system ATP-binding protein